VAQRLLWRITRKDRVQGAFTGKGAAKHGGRWNEKGTPVVHREAPSVGLRVPSVLIPETYNVLLNPEHPGFHRVTIDGPYPLAVDGRLADLIAAAYGRGGKS